MRIALCGSTTHYESMKKIKHRLEALGHIVHHPDDASVLSESKINVSTNSSEGDLISPEKKNMYITRHMNTIHKSEAVLIVNLDKGEKKCYIGGNTFLEMGFALAYGKKIFVYNPVPESGYKEEILGMLPTVIEQDLQLIK